ncbi:MAG TPA: LysR substrate-binding domain-containing protein [Candidatus Dormibacteraeota bacterium]|nr:LysR substrate-binding domain-containing protein [Candidatus Dormibacteraeota bacterium]
MDLAQLRVFAVVARRSSLTAAGEELGLSQPTVSRAVQRLERELGARLLHRRRAVALTPAGHRFLLWAESTLERYRSMREELAGPAEGLSGRLRIAASTTPGEFLVPGLVSSFTAVYRAVEAEVAIADSDEVRRRLSAGTSEVGFVGSASEDERYRHDVIGEDEVVLVVPAGHRLAGRGRVGLRELDGERFVAREAGSGTRATFEAALARRGLPPPRFEVAMTLGSTEAVLSAVQDGCGLGLVSSLALLRRAPGRIAVVRIRELPLRRRLYLVTERGRALTPAAAGFVDWVRRQPR